jgi:hypothetical protein
VAANEEQREQLLQGIVGLQRVRALLPANADVERGIEGLKTALGEGVSQRTAARALGVKLPEVSQLITAKKLKVVDTSRGRGQVELESLVALIVEEEIAPPEAPGWKQRRAAREEAEKNGAPSSKQEELARIMKMRALAFHRAVARNLDAQDIAEAREVLSTMRESGRIDDAKADEWAALLERPVSDIAARIADYSPAGEALREASPFLKH